MEEVIVDSIPRIQPLTLKTPIVEIEADYGSPWIDGAVVMLVLGGLYIVKKMLERIKSDEP